MRPGSSSSERIRLIGEPTSPVDPDPNACRFYGRCPQRQDRCRQMLPLLAVADHTRHAVACHFPV